MSFIDEKEIAAAMSVKLDFDVLPEKATFQEGIRRAPDIKDTVWKEKHSRS